MSKLTHYLMIRCSKEDRRKLEALAKAEGRSLSSMMRRLISQRYDAEIGTAARRKRAYRQKRGGAK